MLVLPGLRDDLLDVDLVVRVCWPTLLNHVAPNVSDWWLGECCVAPADGSARSQSFCFRRGGDEAAWTALHRAYTLRERFRAVRDPIELEAAE